MNIKDLKMIIGVMEDLGHGDDVELVYEDGRDGISELLPIMARPITVSGPFPEGSEVKLVFSVDWT